MKNNIYTRQISRITASLWQLLKKHLLKVGLLLKSYQDSLYFAKSGLLFLRPRFSSGALSRFFLLLFLSAVCVKANAESQAVFQPYFVAAKSREVNFRAGPNIRYPVVLKITRKFEPLKVINKFENWRQVEDSSGDKGWIHVSNLTAKRMAKTKCSGQINLYRKPELNEKVVAHVTNDVLFQVISCTALWCRLERDEIGGWLEKKHLWGAIENE
jgi:SH3-like domain-containing protein